MTNLVGVGTTPIRVLLADDEPLLRQSLRIVIDSQSDLEVVGESASGAGTLRAARELSPDVVLMDIRMPEGDGIHATRDIVEDPALSATRVLVLSMHELDEYVYGALRAGASGFLLKDAHPTVLLEAIRRVHAGEALFAASILTRLVEHYLATPSDLAHPGEEPREAPGIGGLTPRETEVLTQIASGLSNEEIATALRVSGNTVKTHVGNLFAKLHARDRAQLVIAAYDSGLVGPAVRR
ncbi:response regulator transcription factor [Microbacterium oxydans]|uniref:response regulator transcription factor n=1 Tax=Microbacterium oxydans TaxID=82380 RepID=UPI000F8F9E2D|nr:response regulator transcription factor [Microbacterium oxydans]AZS46901.1 Response regulator protein VraR [Microbacterium oxydans]